jgi:hypothetical protein
LKSATTVASGVFPAANGLAVALASVPDGVEVTVKVTAFGPAVKFPLPFSNASSLHSPGNRIVTSEFSTEQVPKVCELN